MAQNLLRSNHPGRRGQEVRRCLISTILVFCIITCRAMSEQKGGQRGRDNEAFPQGCQHLVSGVEENDQGSNSSMQTQLEPNDRKGWQRARVDPEIDLRMQEIFLIFTAQQGPFSASEGSERGVGFHLLSLSKTEYNEVYLVSGLLTFWADEDNYGRRLSMTVELKGVFSNRTGSFCSRGCVGAPLLADVDHKKTRTSQKLNDLNRFHMTPAQFAYIVDHPGSDSVPDTLVERDCEVHVELEFPRVKTIETPLVTGMMASLRSPDDPSYFYLLNISGISKLPYQYDTNVQKEAQILGQFARSDISSGVQKKLKVWSSDLPLCATSTRYRANLFGIVLYSPIWNSSGCLSSHGGLCSPFHNLNISRIVSSQMTIRNIQCTSDWRSISAAFEFVFTQSDTVSPWSKTNKTSTTFLLFAEGFWADKAGQVVMVAHYLASDGTPLDTRIEITLQIPMVQTIHHRYNIIGHVRSSREASDALYFPSFSFLGDLQGYMLQGTDDMYRWADFHPSYIYDSSIEPKIKPVCSLAANTQEKSHRNASFPEATNLEFSASVDIPGFDRTSQQFYYFENLFIGQNDRLAISFDDLNKDKPTQPPRNRLIPISFRYRSYREDLVIETEGYYNKTAGHLCMLGCRRRWEDVAAPYQDDDIWNLNASQINSCDLVFSIQYPPTNPRLWKEHPYVTGSITSLLDAGHPLYFKPLDLKSSMPIISRSLTKWTVLRRNAETIMSLATLSFATFLVAVQVGYSTRESSFKNLRYLSFVMLTIVTSGHMFPLLLSFNAFWTKSVRQSDMLQGTISGFSGWPKAHEVIVRGTSMVALLLELRLLQLVWRSRTSAKSNPQISNADSPRKVSDVSVLLTCVPIYVAMVLVVGFVHWRGHSQHRLYTGEFDYLDQETINNRNREIMRAFLWADLQAFSGIIVDLFLLPQVIANVLWDTEEKVAPLYPLFYIGMTTVRSAQHLFDAFRDANFIQEFETSNYYYANPNWDLYGTEWDFIIPCCSVVLATLLLLQQKYGGRCFIPNRSRRQSVFLGCSRCFPAVVAGARRLMLYTFRGVVGERISSQLVGFQYENL